MALNPGEAKLYSELGKVYLNIPGRLDEVEELLQKAFTLPRTPNETYISMAKLSIRKNDTIGAWKYLQEGLENKFSNYGALQSDEDFVSIKAEKKWVELMQKYFPDQFKK